jgi:anti-sigma-K factor RskA
MQVRIGTIEPGAEPANGSVQEFFFQDGNYRLSVRVNIARPAQGHYAVWLTSERKDPRFMGLLKNAAGDARHELMFEAAEDLRSYSAVLVTLEQEQTPQKPGITQASATLRSPKSS